MPDSILGQPTPQFSTAEYAGTPGIDCCRFCGQAVGGQYYRIKSAMACCNCAGKLEGSIPRNSHALFVRGLLCGVAAALLGLILYAAIGILLEGFVIAYMSFGVGYLVAKAMMLGSKGTGGRRYQLAAVVLTYAAVSMAAIPMGLGLAWKEYKAAQHSQIVQQQSSPQTSEQTPTSTPEQPATKDEDTLTGTNNLIVVQKPSVGAFLGKLAWLGLVSPFYELQEGLSGVIGIIILLVGIQIAWRMTAGKKTAIYGPFDTASKAQQ